MRHFFSFWLTLLEHWTRVSWSQFFCKAVGKKKHDQPPFGPTATHQSTMSCLHQMRSRCGADAVAAIHCINKYDMAHILEYPQPQQRQQQQQTIQIRQHPFQRHTLHNSSNNSNKHCWCHRPAHHSLIPIIPMLLKLMPRSSPPSSSIIDSMHATHTDHATAAHHHHHHHPQFSHLQTGGHQHTT